MTARTVVAVLVERSSFVRRLAASTLTIAAVTAIVLPSWRGTSIDAAAILNE